MYMIKVVLVISNIIVIAFFLTRLYLSYNQKNKKSISILSMFRLITESEITKIFEEVNKFKNSYFEEFEIEQSDETKSFENQALKSYLYQKFTFENINEIGIKGKSKKSQQEKRLISKIQLSFKFMMEISLVVLFYIAYLVFYLIYMWEFRNYSIQTALIQKTVVRTNLMLNYFNSNLAHEIFTRLCLVKEESLEGSSNNLWNKVSEALTILQNQVYSNPDILGENSAEILNHNVCEYIQLKYCNNWDNYLLLKNNSTLNDNSNSKYFIAKGSNYYNIERDFNVSEFMISSNPHFEYSHYDYRNLEFYSNKTLQSNSEEIQQGYKIKNNYIGYELRYVMLSGLDNLIFYNLNKIERAKEFLKKKNMSIKDLNNFIFHRLPEITESLSAANIILDELKLSMIERLEEKYDQAWKIFLSLTILWIFIFSVLMFFKLSRILRKIYKHETLSKRLIGEIPDFTLMNNKELIHELNIIVSNKYSGSDLFYK
mmetsp:Transcript_32806/g.34139  ORF Transcript_32806/g.34139 Transcript_32806/m.34139 type:complete len:486 (+) Transcript_32806:700-2157(+)